MGPEISYIRQMNVNTVQDMRDVKENTRDILVQNTGIAVQNANFATLMELLLKGQCKRYPEPEY